MKTQTSLASVQSEQSLLFMWRNFASLAIHNVPSEDSDQADLNPSPAEPGYTLCKQCRSWSVGLKKPTDLDLHCLPFSFKFIATIQIKQSEWLKIRRRRRGILIYSAWQGLTFARCTCRKVCFLTFRFKGIGRQSRFLCLSRVFLAEILSIFLLFLKSLFPGITS